MAGVIHPTALIEAGVELGKNVSVEAYSILKKGVKVGDNCSIGPHVVIEGNTTLGQNNQVFQFASIGAPPQDLKYQGEDTRLLIGEGNIIREFVTLNRGTIGGHGVTTIGHFNFFMAYSHIAHDCIVGSHCVLANNATLAGHVTIEDYVIFGGMSGVHQFVKIGESAFIGGGSMVSQDAPPFMIVTGDRAKLYGINIVGLTRRGFSEELLTHIKKAYRIIFRTTLILSEAIDKVKREIPPSPEIQHLIEFVETSERGICR